MTARRTMSACDRSAFCLRRRLLGALILLAAMQPSRADCPKSCVCHTPSEVHCAFRYLTAVPDHFPPAVERINLGYVFFYFLFFFIFFKLFVPNVQQVAQMFAIRKEITPILTAGKNIYITKRNYC